MATADQLKALIRSHGEGDETRFYAIALQVAAQAARNGHTKFAQELRELVDNLRKHAGPSITPAKLIPLAQPRGELVGLFAASYPKTRLADMALEPAVEHSLHQVLREQQERERLLAHGFQPQRKLLLLGPPGTGKTMSAGALAGELGLPLLTIQLDSLISKYLGETAAKLRLIFDAIAETRAVYLFDEFDAIGGERSAVNDTGEIRRVMSSFLQFLEQDESQSLILCATNHPALLDRALFRRFDAIIEYLLPSREVVSKIMESRLGLMDTSSVQWSRVARIAAGLSHAEICRSCEAAAKNALLAHRRTIKTADLTAALASRRTAQV
ncbi:AAA family ATPase [Nannocystis punicea]|uniref:ATP-binding protein n=1 Tax=Nannocystis punicea TaxID=2995304 RepID=A0ABY7H058_9BACT|nr:ATP-binding protein [Nannocystis poenicansa]WAS92625.1 ATP-binding protein [Nannocystis poenicansa]